MYYVYILTDQRNKIYYTGLTDDVIRRNVEHKFGIYNGFTKKYRVEKLVYYEKHTSFEMATKREYLIKRWKRSYKISVIEQMNPFWEDLLTKLSNGEVEPDPAIRRG